MTNRKRQLGWCLVLSATACGCTSLRPAWMKLPEPEVADVRPIREERANVAVREFDQRRCRALLLAAQASHRQNDFDTCNDSLDKILAVDPNHREALLLQAEVALETDHTIDAVAGLRRAAAAWPKDAEVLYQLGVALDAAGKLGEALPYLREAAELSPRNEEFADALAQAEEELAEPSAVAAQPAATEKQVQSSASPAAVVPPVDHEFAAALSAWEAGRNDECAVKVAKLLKQQPNHLDANILQAEIDLAAGRRDKAVERMDRLVVHFPRNSQVRRAAALVNESAQELEKAALYDGEANSLDNRAPVVVVSHEEPIVAAKVTAERTSKPSKLRQPESLVITRNEPGLPQKARDAE